MVFQNNRKWRKPLKQPTKSVKDLPDELLLKILEHATVTDVLRCREASKFFVPACTTTIRSRLKVLYVHPSYSSLQKTIDICHSDLGSDIEEICFVAVSFWPPRYGRTRYIAYQWPSRFPRKKTDILQHDAASFEETYSAILTALARLKKVDAFSFVGDCLKPGFNMMSQDSLSYYESARHAPIHLSMGHLSKEYFSHVDAIMSMFQHPHINFHRFKLEGLALLFEDAPQQFKDPSSIAKMQYLTSFEYHCRKSLHQVQSSEDWLIFSQGALKAAAYTLQSLVLVFATTMKRSSSFCDDTLDYMLEHRNFPRLEHLELRTQPSKYVERPLCFNFDMVHFLQKLDNIRSLQLTNVAFSADLDKMGNSRSMTTQIRKIATSFRTGAANRKLSWKINYYFHHRRCKHVGTDEKRITPECKPNCGIFDSTGLWFNKTNTIDMERLAAELGVKLSEPEQVWNFGTVVEDE